MREERQKRQRHNGLRGEHLPLEGKMFHVEHTAMDPLHLLLEGSRSLGVSLDSEAVDRFAAYLREIKEWSRAFNLTSLKDDHEIVIKHFLDSLVPASHLLTAASLLDIGSGAGFPGIPLKILLNHLDVVLVDSSLKKVRFLQHIIHCLDLDHIAVIHHHLERRGSSPHDLTSYDAIISRGTFPPGDLLSLALRHLNPKGVVIWMYGSRKKAEVLLDSIQKDITPSYAISSMQTVLLPFLHHERTITLFTSII